MSSAPHAMDLDALTAIDVHVHVHADAHGHLALDDELNAAAAKYFKGDPYDPTVPEIAADYRGEEHGRGHLHRRRRGGHRASGAVQRGDRRGRRRAPRRADPVRLDRPRPRAWPGCAPARRLVESHGVRGFKFHPSLQDFPPNDRAVYPLYEELQSLGVPALFHTGQTGIGAGLPGGRGIKLRYSDPMLLDDVAADFPDLTIIMAHPSVPWQDAAISVATHKANVYIDLSGWSPKYFPPQLVRAANTPAQEQGALRLGLPAAAPRTLDRRLRAPWRSATRSAR